MSEQKEKLSGTIREACDVLDIGINEGYAAARRGEIPTMRVGNRWIVLWQPLLRRLKGEVVT
jgi:hypothetical protein